MFGKTKTVQETLSDTVNATLKIFTEARENLEKVVTDVEAETKVLEEQKQLLATKQAELGKISEIAKVNLEKIPDIKPIE